MRLLHVRKFTFRWFQADPEPYAILSHRWGEVETLLEDIQNGRVTPSTECKVSAFARYVRDHVGVNWIWVDGCCIKQESTAELSESINRMFDWYRNATVCLAYLPDVDQPSDLVAFCKSVWFKRGWTLQELLASTVVVFLTSGWEVIGHKGDADHLEASAGDNIELMLAKKTRIPCDVLRDFRASLAMSVEERMSWMDGRETFKEEDMFYALFGVFGVTPGVNYGEKRAGAEQRLREAIQRKERQGRELVAAHVQDRWLATFAGQIVKASMSLKATSGRVSPLDRAKALIRRTCAQDMRRVLNHYLARQFEGTTQWILDNDDFRGWLHGSATRILLLTGKIGSGKTFVMATVVRHLSDLAGPQHVVLYYFAEQSGVTALEIFRTFAKQLIEAYGRINKDVPSEVAKELESAFGADNRVPDHVSLLRFVLIPLASGFERILICLDGIELCEEESQRRILEAMKKIESKCLITCRDTVTMREVLTDKPITVSMDNAQTLQDLELYIDEHLRQLSGLHDLLHEDAFRERIKKDLLSKADGMFLWVHLQLELIRDCQGPDDVAVTMQNLPIKLEEVFQQCLFQKVRGRYRCDPKILKWVAAVREPITVQELSEMLSLTSTSSKPSSMSILRSGTNLIVQQDQSLRVVHHSVRTYLFSPDLRAAIANVAGFDSGYFRELNCTEESAILDIASVSLEHIQRSCGGTLTVRKTIEVPTFKYKIPGPIRIFWPGKMASTYNMAVPGLPQRQSEPATDFLRFAIRTWPIHTKSIRDEDRVWEAFKDVALSSDMLQPVHPWDNQESRLLRTGNTHIRGLFGYAVAHDHLPLLRLTLIPRSLLPKGVYDSVLPSNDLRPALHLAAEAGYSKIVLALLAVCNVNLQDPRDHLTALYCAVRGGHHAIVRLLIEKGAKVNVRIGQNNQHTALGCAVDLGRADIAELLLDRGADPDTKHTRHGNVLHAAIVAGHVQIVNLLAGKGANVNKIPASVNSEILQNATKDGHFMAAKILLGMTVDIDLAPSLALASEKGHVELVRLLLEKGADINAHDGQALLRASEEGHIQVVRLLIRKGADVNAFKGQALVKALAGGHAGVVRLLLDNGAHCDRGYGSELVQAAWNGHIEVVRLLIEKGADIGVWDGAVLGAASGSGHVEVVRLLLEQGADVNARSGTILEGAISAGHKEIVKLLLEMGANIDAHHGFALRCASRSGKIELVKLLLRIGADVNAGFFGFDESAIDCALRQSHTKVVKLLLEHGAIATKAIAAGVDGRPVPTTFEAEYRGWVASVVQKGIHAKASLPLEVSEEVFLYASSNDHLAVMRVLLKKDIGARGGVSADMLNKGLIHASVQGVDAMVELLLEKGADIMYVSSEHGSALCAASARGRQSLMSLLLENGADINARIPETDSSAIEIASEGKYFNTNEMVKLLLDNGPDAESIQKAIRKARGKDRKEVVDLLQHHLRAQTRG